MNKPQTFEPVAPLFLAEGVSIHSSVRTSVSTNLNPDAGQPASISTGMTRLDLVVGERGQLRVRYSVQPVVRVPARALGRRMVSARR